MTTQATPFRPIAVAMRDDLDIVEQTFRGERAIVVGDPIAMEYHNFNDQEFALLESLDGTRSADAIKRDFELKFAPYQIEYREIEQYIIQFKEKNLLQSSASNIGSNLRLNAKKQKWKKRLAKTKSILSFRFRGLNPERQLAWLTPKFGWLFSRQTVAVNLLLMGCALALLAVNFESFQDRLPSLSEFFSPRNWIAIALVILITKVIHELGHGILYTKYGGRCHDMGVMIMVFMPTLYVNASGAWKIQDKWKRAAIGAAGMYVELTMAAIATFVWWYSHPGIVQYTALNVMATCSFSALVINANPLLKFDGYFIFSDVLELPNLQQRASTLTKQKLLSLFFGIEDRSEPTATERTKTILMSYAILAYLFRFVIIFGIAFAMVNALNFVGMGNIGKLLSAGSMLAVLAMPAIAVYKHFKQPGHLQRIDMKRGMIVLPLMLLLIVGLFFIPFPDTVVCNLIVEPRGVATAIALQNGTIKEIAVVEGQRVKKGDVILIQQNFDVEIETEKALGEIAELRRQESAIQQYRNLGADDIRQRAEIRSMIESKESTLRELQQKVDQLTVRAANSGHVIPHWVEDSSLRDDKTLDGFQGWTIGPESQGAFLRRGDIVCRIGDLETFQAKLTIDQFDVQRIAKGQPVRLLLASDSDEVLTGTIDSISALNVDNVPATMAMRYGGSTESIGTAPVGDDPGSGRKVVKPSASTYEAIVYFDSNNYATKPGFQGTAKIRVGSSSAFAHFTRFMSRLFRFQLATS